MVSILIATPSTGSIKAACAQSTVKAVIALERAGHSVEYLTRVGSDIVRQRNVLLSRFLCEPSFTHFLGIDSDMSFASALPLRMLALDKPFVGVSYPHKSIDLSKLITLARTTSRPNEKLIAASQRYHVRILEQNAEIVDGVCRVEGVGFGLVLLRREVVETMVARSVVKKVKDDDLTRHEHLSAGLFNFFDIVYPPEALDIGLSEDFSFCHRWKHGCGGEIWAIIDADVGHVGDMRFGQSFVASRSND